MALNNVVVHGSRFQVVHVEYLDIPVHSLDWSGSHLLVSSKQGITRLYAVRGQFKEGQEDDSKITQAAEYTMPVHDAPVVPGQYPMNSLVKSVRFNANYSDERVYELWQPLTPFSTTTNVTEDQQLQQENESSASSVSTEFLTTFMSHINVWDALHEEKPKFSLNLGNTDPINCANWSPHAPHTLIVTGGCGRALRIIDVRAKDVVWQAEEAHQRPIRDAKFNTFIPYWLASAGEDGAVNLFDIRASYHAPVAKITAHEGVVESISWSNMRPENLTTASSDVFDTHYQTAKWTKTDTPPATIRPMTKALWYSWLGSTVDEPWSAVDQHINYGDNDDPWGHSTDCDPEAMLLCGAIGIGEWGRSDKGPVYVGEDFEKSKGPVVGVSTSKSLLAEYYCITDRGQLAVQTVRLENDEQINFKFRYKKEEYPLAYQVEYDIYSRHIDRAWEDLEQLKNINCDDIREREEQVTYLENCLNVLPPIAPKTWGFDTIPDKTDRRTSRRLWNQDDLWELAISTFRKDLDFWSSARLPPGYETRYGFDVNIKDRTMAPAIVSPSVTTMPEEYGGDDNDYGFGNAGTADSDHSTTMSSAAAVSTTQAVVEGGEQDRKPSEPETKKTEWTISSPAKNTPGRQRSSTLSITRSRASTIRSLASGSLGRSSSDRQSKNDVQNTNPFLQQEVPTPPTSQNQQDQQQQQQQQQQHHHHRFVRPTQSLKRMFSRRSKHHQHDPPPEPKTTEQEESVMPEPPISRKRTTRRNALFGAS
ncbi:WD40-repeat-containing domain protein [Zychaea mexicana]|uniref:WD40-repeat-containing domain protein n=1 Tax=Zychaea mexicana TaxID=64656 RepID=UPI0022FEAB45|nr:WD40-repeat-containing domain protein [Zychaea mexicana]KAI9492954.1 WD40-repeat-containing domain protein [Zychaea mexicana]